MLDDPKIQTLMRQVAAGILPTTGLLEIRSEPVEDSEGHEALRITLVMAEDAIDALTPVQLVALLREVHDSLLREGDERFPLLSYATPADLIAGQDSED